MASRTPAQLAEGTGEKAGSEVPDGVLIDFVDGSFRRKTPEEYVRQNLERALVQEYRYPREELAIEYPIRIGSTKKRVDIAVFNEGAERKQENLLLIVECKKEGTSSTDKREGVGQLMSYMAASVNCKFGLWTNGTDERLCLRKDTVGGEIVFVELVDLPTKGSGGLDTDFPTRHELRPASGDNLLLAFKRCHNYIAGNQGLQKPEAFWELLKIIFCKIEDERSFGSLSFYVTTREQRSRDGQLKCRKRLAKLFEEVKKKVPTIFKATEELELILPVLGYVTAQLQGFSLLDSDVDVKGVAYEEVVGSNLRGDRGEFFTPRNACRMAVDLLDPQPGQRIADPACGTGGFLVIAMNHLLRKVEALARSRWRNPAKPTDAELREYYRARDAQMANVVGFDINPNLVRAAKMNMVMNNDGSGGLTQNDSLKDPVTWLADARKLGPLGSFDIVFTNPPFGTRIKIDAPDTLAQYDLAAAWDWNEGSCRWEKRLTSDGKVVLQSGQPPEILFIERCVQLLKPGTGCLAIVVPNGILNNPPLAYVRQWLLDHTQLLAVVDMQRDLFQPRNDTQTSMVFLRRRTIAQIGKGKDYPIFMAVADRIGHDKRGIPIYRRNEDGSDVMVSRTAIVKTVSGGEVVEKEIAETVPMVDDQLPEVSPAYRKWAKEHLR